LAAKLSGELGRQREAADLWERAVQINPYALAYQFEHARSLLQLGAWERAISVCRTALQLNPAHLGTRQVLVEAARQQGDRPLAEREFDRLLRCAPPEQQPALRAWFDGPR